MLFFDYEGELFDTKYCFEFIGDKESVKNGDNPFDRWADRIHIRAYGFLEDVSIETLEYSYVSRYDVVYLQPDVNFYMYYNTADAVDLDLLTCKWEDAFNEAVISRDDAIFFHIYRKKDYEFLKMDNEYIDVVFSSMVFVGDYYYY